MKRLAFSLLFILSGCISAQTSLPLTNEPLLSVQWQELRRGLHTREFPVYKNAELQEKLLVLRIAPDVVFGELKIDTSSPKTVTEWRKELGASVIINASYFDESDTPTGYLKSRDRFFGKYSSDGSNGYTGLVYFDKGQIRLRYLPDNPLLEPPQEGFQSYPTLFIKDTRNLISSDSKKISRRAVIGQDERHATYLLVAPRNYFSLYQLSEFIREHLPEISIAINLDGGPSAGLSLLTESVSFDIESQEIPAVIAFYP